MLRLALSSEDTYLLLAPRWSGWGEFGQGAALAALLFVPLLLIAALYRYELKLVSRRAAVALLLLRLLGLGILWGLAGLQPSVVHVEQEESPSRVILAVDLSASMNVADPQRTWAERIRLGQALRLIPGSPAGDRWLEMAEQKAPLWDAEAISLGETVDRLTRKEIARRLLDAEHRNLMGRLAQQHRVEVIGFHQAVQNAAPGAVAALFQGADKSADAAGTNLALPLQRAAHAEAQVQGKLLGVILLTDGQHNQGPAPLAIAKELARQQVPVFPIAIGSKQPPADLAVLDVQAPKQVFKDAEATVEIKLRAAGLTAQEIMVELHGSGKLAKQEKNIRHDGKDRVYTTSFTVKLEEVGTQRLEVRVKPQDPQTRETTTDNNQLATVVRVASEKARVLIIDDEPRWEYHYLATALARDPDLQLDRVLFSQPRIGTLKEDQLEKLGHARRQLPVTDGAKEDPLWQYECVLLGDVAPEQLPANDRLRLERYVADRGGTLVVVAGKRHMPMAYFAAADDPLLKLLPLRQPAILEPKDGFAFTLTEMGETTGFLQLEKDTDTNRQRWAEMPKHFWGVTGIAKPGAVVLARAQHATLPKAKDPADDAAGLVLQQPYGFGKVLYVGVESTWRWRYRVGDLYHHRVWGQAMRWAISDAWLPEGNRFARFGAKAPVYRHDQEVELSVRLGEEAPALAAATARIKVVRKQGEKEETVATLPLVQDKLRAKQWNGSVKQLPPGQYRVELDVPELGGVLAKEEQKPGASHGFTVLPPEQGELIDVATNWDLLRALAEETQGRMFSAEDADQLPDLLARQVEKKVSRTEARLWQDMPMVWWVLGTLVTLLTLEWILRKLVGLP